VRAVYDDIMATRGVPDVNNFWKYLAHDPVALKRTWDSLKEVMRPGALDPLTKELVYLAVSISNGCDYCIAHGLEGLKDLPPVHKTHPMTTPIEVVERVLAISSDNPAWGCVRIADQLQLEGVRLSSPTVQAILIKHGVGTKYERLLRLEERMATEPIALTAEQIRLIEKANPAFRERHVESARPGELLAQDTFYVGNFKGLGKVYMQAVVDTFGSYGFATLHTSKRPETAALILHNEELPFYAERGLPVAAVLTDNGR
jgi:hypothetical protein